MARASWTMAVAAIAAAWAGTALAQDAKPAAAPGSGAAAEAKPDVTLRYTTGAPKGTPWVMQLERFQKDVTEESKGRIKIDAFIAAQLGNEQDTIQQVARGRIDMGGFSSVSSALLAPEMGLFSLPFYFASTKQQDCTLDKLSGAITERFAKKGVRFLGWTEVGTADIIGKKPFKLPSDVKGLKAAAASTRTSAMFWQSLGANPTPIGITEIASAFQTGLAEVQGQVVTFYVPSGLSKVAPVMTRVELSDAPGVIIINQAAYDKMPKDLQRAMDRAVARRHPNQLRAEIRGFEQKLRDLHVSQGGQIVTVTPAEREEWRKVLTPKWPDMVKEYGADGESLIKLMEEGKKACAA